MFTSTLTHLGKEVIDEKLPEITGFARTYLGVEPTTDPIPIQPTAHYAMGGIPTNVNCEVLKNESGEIVKGLYAAGECACVSVHGGNRLGTNSLLDLVVFGRRGGKAIADFLKEAKHHEISESAADRTRELISSIMGNQGTEKISNLRTELQNNMMELCGIFRNEDRPEKDDRYPRRSQKKSKECFSAGQRKSIQYRADRRA
jgi:succinate dehydrogenase / fumarate reductase flavoprotein subunit